MSDGERGREARGSTKANALEWTPLRLLEWTTRRFTDANIDSPRLAAQVLLAHALECDRVQLYVQHDKPLGPDELGRYR